MSKTQYKATIIVPARFARLQDEIRDFIVRYTGATATSEFEVEIEIDDKAERFWIRDFTGLTAKRTTQQTTLTCAIRDLNNMTGPDDFEEVKRSAFRELAEHAGAMRAPFETEFFDAVLVLRGRRYQGIVEITSKKESPQNVADSWQVLYPPPEGADPNDIPYLDLWNRLENGRPAHLPAEPALTPGPRRIRIWKSDEI